ncbi:MAG: hypothetical protein V4619_07600 [Bacteroidota bacterium]
MKAAERHFKFINSKTGYVIFHHSVKAELPETELKAELERVKADVASSKGVFLDTIYWEEEKAD